MPRILVIDDNAEFCSILQAHLTTNGHRVEITQDGDHGLRLLEDGRFDLVLTDILMPQRDGIEILRQVKQRWPALPVIAVSGGGWLAAEDLLAMAGRLGADRVMQKPVRREDLLNAVDAVLREVLRDAG
ncbi:response regulator [Ferrovibrio sp.]|uniref:response regulator n=1 Tax=Ferrovibrio sp. TaxID=1917215 RepID=UPI0026097C0A|nr:response regulator [Ferrovibrio sp.]